VRLPDPAIEIADVGIARTEANGLLLEADGRFHGSGHHLARSKEV
jgi:hypothetical protein